MTATPVGAQALNQVNDAYPKPEVPAYWHPDVATPNTGGVLLWIPPDDTTIPNALNDAAEPLGDKPSLLCDYQPGVETRDGVSQVVRYCAKYVLFQTPWSSNEPYFGKDTNGSANTPHPEGVTFQFSLVDGTKVVLPQLVYYPVYFVSHANRFSGGSFSSCRARSCPDGHAYGWNSHMEWFYIPVLYRQVCDVSMCPPSDPPGGGGSSPKPPTVTPGLVLKGPGYARTNTDETVVVTSDIQGEPRIDGDSFGSDPSSDLSASSGVVWDVSSAVTSVTVVKPESYPADRVAEVSRSLNAPPGSARIVLRFSQATAGDNPFYVQAMIAVTITKRQWTRTNGVVSYETTGVSVSPMMRSTSIVVVGGTLN